MYPASLTHIVVYNLKAHQYQPIRVTDFEPYHSHIDCTAVAHMALTDSAYSKLPIPTSIDVDTPPLPISDKLNCTVTPINGKQPTMKSSPTSTNKTA